jgi:hypothetical protein
LYIEYIVINSKTTVSIKYYNRFKMKKKQKSKNV